MREAIGSSLLLNIVIVIIGVISAFLISSIAYSKAFKAKNRIIAVIDEYDRICAFDGYGTDDCTKKIEAELNDMGYSSNISKDCGKITVGTDELDPIYKGIGGHMFCVYSVTLCDKSDNKCKLNSSKSHYYKVKTFMHFDIPVIGRFLEFPVTGDTRVYIDKYSNIGE